MSSSDQEQEQQQQQEVVKKEEEEKTTSSSESQQQEPAEAEEKKEVKKEDAPETTAVAALTSLNGSVHGSDEEEEEEEEEKEMMEGEDEAAAAAEVGDDSDFKIPLRLTKSGRRRATPFPLKLMKVLSTKEFTEIIAWTPSGKAFNILQPKLFVAGILPEHFKSAKYSSFTRKLHRWGFMRHYRGPEAGAFFHKSFRRGRMDLVEKMSCYKPAAPTSSSSNNNNTPSNGGAGGSNKSANNNNNGGSSVNMRLNKMLDDQAPAMDTSGSSRTSGSLGNSNNAMTASMMGNLGFGAQFAGAGFNSLSLPQAQAALGGAAGLPQQLFMQGFGGMTPMQQQQLFLQQQTQQQQQQQQFQQQQQQLQQQQFAIHQQQLQQAAAAQQQQQLAQAAAGGGTGESGLDVAIEMEVTRRLKERINAAALSRQALSSMMPGGGGGGGGGAGGPSPGGAQGNAGPSSHQLGNHQQMVSTQLQPMDSRFSSMFGNGGASASAGGAPSGVGGAAGHLQGYSKALEQGMASFGSPVGAPAGMDPFGMPTSNIQGAKTA